MNGLEKRMLLMNLVFIGVGLGISLAVNLVMFALLGDRAFPWNLGVMVVIYLVFGMAIQRRMIRRANSGQKASFFSLPKPEVNKYRCSNCGKSYKGDKCPDCGFHGGSVIFSE